MASKGIGRILQFGIAKETTRGTSPAAADFWIPFTELDFNEKWDNILDEQSRGRIEDSTGQSRAKNWSEGTYKGPVEDKSIGLILYAAFGTVSSATNSDASGTVRDHTITVANSAQHQTLSAYIDDSLSGQDYTYANGAIDSLELNYEQKKFVEVAITLKGKKGATATLTPATVVQNRFLPQHFSFKVASAYGQLSTGSAIVLKSLKLKINKNLESDDVLGSTDPADYLNKALSIEGTVEALWQNESDFKTAALANTAKAIRIALTNTDVTIGTSANPAITIDFAKVIFKELTRPLVLNDLVKQTLSFKAHYSTTDSLMISTKVTNLQGSY